MLIATAGEVQHLVSIYWDAPYVVDETKSAERSDGRVAAALPHAKFECASWLSPWPLEPAPIGAAIFTSLHNSTHKSERFFPFCKSSMPNTRRIAQACVDTSVCDVCTRPFVFCSEFDRCSHVHAGSDFLQDMKLLRICCTSVFGTPRLPPPRQPSGIRAQTLWLTCP